MIVLFHVEATSIVEKGKTAEVEGFHVCVMIGTVVVLQVSFELKPQLPPDTPLCVGDHEMMLLHACNIIENKARAARVPERRVDLDRNDRQFLRAQDERFACPLDKCHLIS